MLTIGERLESAEACLKAVEKAKRGLEADHAQLVALVSKLPLASKQVRVELNQKRQYWEVIAQEEGYVKYCGMFYTLELAEAYAALLQARKELG